MYLRLTVILSVLMLIGILSCKRQEEGNSTARKVEVVGDTAGYRLLVDGEPFYIKGAGLEFGDIPLLAAEGGNSFRTWRIDNGERPAIEILDEAHAHGLMVCMGIEVGRERHGFDYDDPEQVRAQKERILAEVGPLKDHPALLMWGVGNELNLEYTNPKVWDAVEEIAAAIKDIDPNHPVTTMMAGVGKREVNYIRERCPSLDLLAFQIYGDILNLPKYISESGWTGPYIITEWGPTGHWESPQTSWGRPVEQTSTQKAESILERYSKVIAADPGHCLGSYVFLWGQKQERTPTWYGLFLENGYKTASVDAMHYLWTGGWPANQSPRIDSFRLGGLDAVAGIELMAGEEMNATVYSSDPDGDSLRFVWEIIPEVPLEQQSMGGDPEDRQTTTYHLETRQAEMSLSADFPKGEYRLMIYVLDTDSAAATANIPFRLN